MRHGDFVLVCADHWEPWIPTLRACGPITTHRIAKHEDLSEWEEYDREMDGPLDLQTVIGRDGEPKWMPGDELDGPIV
jgi:hypothetical protein